MRHPTCAKAAAWAMLAIIAGVHLALIALTVR